MEELPYDEIARKIYQANFTKVQSAFRKSFENWAETVQTVQRQTLDFYQILRENYYESPDTPIAKWVLTNAVANWLGVAEVARQLVITSESISNDCNKRVGYPIDIHGDIQDVFSQQRQWNDKFDSQHTDGIS